MNKEIVNFNSKEQYHGYQQWYWDNKLSYRGNNKNGERYGYSEYHMAKTTYFYIK